MKKLLLVIFIISTLTALLFFNRVPEEYASHWNYKGEVDGFMPKFFGLFLFPIIFIVLFLMYYYIPKIDPLKKNIKSFKEYFNGLIIMLFLFFLIIQVYTILWNIGVKISPNIIMPIITGVLFFYLGIVMKYFKRNHFIGIRTPWTISNDRVWNKTHRVGSKLFMISGIITLLGAVIIQYSILFVLVPIITSTIFLIIYSYYISK